MIIVFLAFLLALGPLVFIHELGHFLAAKGFGIGVPVFSLGFGPRIFGFRRKETDYRVSAIPLGGYVRLAGDEADENRTGGPEEFLSRPRWQRFVVYIAGATFNIVFAVLVVFVLFWIYGKSEGPPSVYPTVASVAPDSAAAAAGIEPGDRVLKIAGKDVFEWEEFTEAYRLALQSPAPAAVALERGGEKIEKSLELGKAWAGGQGQVGWQLTWSGWGPPEIGAIEDDSPAARAGLKLGDKIVGVGGRKPVYEPELRALLGGSPGHPVVLALEREGQAQEVEVTPRDDDGRGKIGVIFRQTEVVHRELGPGEAFAESVRMNVNLSTTVLLTIKRMITRQESVKSLSGPIEIAKVARRALVQGLDAFFSFLAFVSLQLGVFNLLPIPVLDGGHILVLSAEGVMRRDLSERVKERVMQAGLVFLLLFFAMVMYNDLAKSNAFGFLKGLF